MLPSLISFSRDHSFQESFKSDRISLLDLRAWSPSGTYSSFILRELLNVNHEILEIFSNSEISIYVTSEFTAIVLSDRLLYPSRMTSEHLTLLT